MATFDEMADRLRRETKASRATIRLFDERGTVDLVGESLGPGVQSMKKGRDFNLTSAGTYQYLSQHNRPLVQDDCRTATPAPPKELVDIHRVYAQMVASVLSNGRMVATVAVHQVDSPRHWTKHDVAALRRAVRQTEVQVNAETI